MCDQLVHRGPDGEGYYHLGRVGLGHRRLSIIDVEGGAQPIGNEDGSVQIVFNGEIYNFRELRRQLAAKNHRFQTNTDTEVLVHLYEEAGSDLVNHLNGMFAFAIWDEQRQLLLLARDRLGKKPVYYTTSVPGFEICFASELKALTCIEGFPKAVSAQAVADFLCLDYIPDPQTIYKTVSKLPPGHTLTLERGSVKLNRYWKPTYALGQEEPDKDLIPKVQDLARDCVECRLISDVPLGAFLSGGVDSSAVVGLMSQRNDANVKTFSIGFTDKSFDELEFAHLVAKRYQTEHREEVVNPSVHEMLDKIVRHFDEPFGDSSAIPMLYLCRMTRQYVTVALCGDGADEVFGGYRRYYFGVLEERLRHLFPGWFRRSVIRTAGRLYPKFDYLPRPLRAKTLLTNLAREAGDAYFTTMSAFRDADLISALSPEMRRALGGYSPRAAFREKFQAVRELPPLAQMQAIDFQTYLPGDILVKTDRASMAYSLEGRSPWLDYRMVELACTLPESLKLRRRVGKHIFKEAMAPFVPERNLRRRKMGFSVPLAHWFRGSLRQTFEQAVFREETSEFLERGHIRRLWTQHQQGLRNHDERLWNVLVLSLWNLAHNHGLQADPVAESIRAGQAPPLRR